MRILSFEIEGAEAVRNVSSPMIHLHTRVTAHAGTRVHSLTLRCQVQIEPKKRSYDAAEGAALADLFGSPERWPTTMGPLHWTNTHVSVPGFEESTVAPLPLASTYDFAVAASQYLSAVRDGEVPLRLLFSGTVFYAGAEGALQVTQVPWSEEASFRLPVSVVREAVDLFYPQTAGLLLPRDVFDRLNRYRLEEGIPTIGQTIERLLTASERRP